MNCIECGAQMVAGPVEIKGNYRGLSLAVGMEDGWSCSECGYATISGQHSSEFGQRLREKYREALGHMGADEVRAIRASTGLSQREFAKVTGIPIATLKRMERRGIASTALNELARQIFGRLAPNLGASELEIVVLPEVTRATKVCWVGASKAFEDSLAVANAAAAQSQRDAPDLVWMALGEHVWSMGVRCSTLANEEIVAERLHHGHKSAAKGQKKQGRRQSEASVLA